MIRRLLTAALDAGTLSRTVLVLSRQLDNAHLLAASEEARADRAELRVAELEHQLEDWREASGELATEQPAADALPDLTDAGEAPIPLVLTDSAREADIQRDRADALQRALQACEVDLAKLREAKLAADIRADVQRERAEQAERDRDTNARAAGAHIATINDLRKRLDDALRAAAPVEQIPGVAAADALTESERREGYHFGKLTGIGFAAGCEAIAETKARMARPGNVTAPTDDPPPTRPSSATRTT